MLIMDAILWVKPLRTLFALARRLGVGTRGTELVTCHATSNRQTGSYEIRASPTPAGLGHHDAEIDVLGLKNEYP